MTIRKTTAIKTNGRTTDTVGNVLAITVTTTVV